MLNERKILLAKRITYTLIVSKIVYILADLFFANQKMSIVILMSLFFDIIVAVKIGNQFLKARIFLGIMANSIFLSFLCNYFSLDLNFIPAFCILFMIPTIIFERVLMSVLQIINVLNITLILILYKGSYQFWSTYEEEGFAISLRVLYYISIFTISFFIIDFYKNKNIEKSVKKRTYYHNDLLTDGNNGSSDNTYTTKDIQYVFESIEKKNNSFMATFLNEYPDFLDKILYLNPKITEKELEICAFTKLGFTTKEIAQATNSTYKSIEAKKYRVRKKLNLDSSVNLVLFFNSL